MHDETDDHRDAAAAADASETHPSATGAASPPQDAPAPDAGAADSAPSAEAVEEFERLAVLRMGGHDIEGALDELPEAEAREVAEVAIDRVVRTYENL
jgi:hypothetical protein